MGGAEILGLLEAKAVDWRRLCLWWRGGVVKRGVGRWDWRVVPWWLRAERWRAVVRDLRARAFLDDAVVRHREERRRREEDAMVVLMGRQKSEHKMGGRFFATDGPEKGYLDILRRASGSIFWVAPLLGNIFSKKSLSSPFHAVSNHLRHQSKKLPQPRPLQWQQQQRHLPDAPVEEGNNDSKDTDSVTVQIDAQFLATPITFYFDRRSSQRRQSGWKWNQCF